MEGPESLLNYPPPPHNQKKNQDLGTCHTECPKSPSHIKLYPLSFLPPFQSWKNPEAGVEGRQAVTELHGAGDVVYSPP